MEKIAIELKENVNNVIEKVLLRSLNSDNLKNMSESDLEGIKVTLKLLDKFNDYCIEEAKTLDRIEGKLNKLLAKK